uniref:DNA polymerase theta-like n=1 Tax=Dermatophagoides pteronyssinus TaxID=6956 RepID=A0A6P6XJ77_DERPT|nr:DNA polymerase theta-like [Dermatophagoides pteronyssinus]
MTKNFLYSAPTGGGKTLVADLLAIRNLERNGRIIYLIPYIALIKQKARDLKKIFNDSNKVVVELYFGSKDTLNNDYDLAVCTIEQGTKIIQSILKKKSKNNRFYTIIIDEFHIFFTPERGLLLENMLIKTQPDVTNLSCQIIGMSATFPNLNEVAKWLNAATYQCSYRPIPLLEFITAKIFNEIANLNCVKERKQMLGDLFCNGVAFHHSGMTNDERILIVDFYADKTIKCLFCTTGLAAGMNLPAHRVFINGINLGKSRMNLLDYKQISGRAGRVGYSDFGEIFVLVSTSNDFERATKLLTDTKYNLELSSSYSQVNERNAFDRRA